MGDDSLFDMYDLDGDGIIDADEFIAGQAAEKTFKKLDANGDGKIDREEWFAMYGSYDGFDANEFIRVSEQQMNFRRFDTDRDGQISTAEKYRGLGIGNPLPQVGRLAGPQVALVPQETPRTATRNRQEGAPRLSIRDCVRFNTPGGCPKGEECLFDHVKRGFRLQMEPRLIADSCGNCSPTVLNY